MKRVINIILLTFISFMIFIGKTYAKEVNVYVFYGKTCPHCHEAMEYLDSIESKYDINVIKYEVWYDNDNKKIMDDVADFLDINVKGVPFVVIDNTPIIGFSSGNTDNTYLYHIKKASSNGFIDQVGIHMGIVNKEINQKNNTINILGNDIDGHKSNMFIISSLLGLTDFTHISMFLIIIMFSIILVNLKNKKYGFIVGFALNVIISFIYLINILIRADYSKYLSVINIIRVFTSVLLIISGIVGLIIIMNKLDNKKTNNENKIYSYIIKDKNKLLIIYSVMVTLLSLSCVFLRYNDISLLLPSASYKICYFIIYILVNTILYMLIYKLLCTLKLYDKNNKYSIIITTVILIVFGIVLGVFKI